VTVLDVREADEYEAGHVPGAVNVPYRTLRGRSDLVARPVVTICESGPRAAVAASLLAREGIDARPVATGMNEWKGPREP
ncbi:MAG TPA: rhodanese-like domain-containing protein, partial [Gaiellaceae bacterium]|nr:rhodanese-like domain-containing protein [Gaiellaceae bacterium]